MPVNYTVRYATHPEAFKSYDTQRLREEFLIEDLFNPDTLNLIYSHYDRYIVGGVQPVNDSVQLETIDPLKSEHFLDRRELGVINVGGAGTITADGTTYTLKNSEAIYVGRGTKEVTFASEGDEPALFYINSAPAHRENPTKHVTLDEAETVELGSLEESNHRVINKLLVSSVVDTCQLQMGMTILKEGSVWNTMPAHVHDRRMEAYFYFDLPEDQVVSHFIGQPDESRHIFMKNNQAVLSPPWSIHCGAGTSSYSFIWGMAGENLDYGDMDIVDPTDMK